MWSSLIQRVLGKSNGTRVESAAVDPLTGLPTRLAVISELTRRLARAHHKQPVAVAIVDFTSTRESLDGIPATDPVLVQRLAQLLRSLIPAQHMVGHLRESEFALILSDVTMGQVEHLADEITGKVRADQTLKIQRGQIATIVGVGYSERSNCQASQLMRHADLALHFALSTGRSWHAIVDEKPQMRAA